MKDLCPRCSVSLLFLILSFLQCISFSFSLLLFSDHSFEPRITPKGVNYKYFLKKLFKSYPYRRCAAVPHYTSVSTVLAIFQHTNKKYLVTNAPIVE